MRAIKLEELQKGDLILVRWQDASEMRAKIDQHSDSPDVYVKDWGPFLGIVGVKRKYIVIGKDVVEVWNEWGAARIPIELVESITLLMDREVLAKALTEVQGLVRKVRLRKYSRIGVD